MCGTSSLAWMMHARTLDAYATIMTLGMVIGLTVKLAMYKKNVFGVGCPLNLVLSWNIGV